MVGGQRGLHIRSHEGNQMGGQAEAVQKVMGCHLRPTCKTRIEGGDMGDKLGVMGPRLVVQQKERERRIRPGLLPLVLEAQNDGDYPSAACSCSQLLPAGKCWD